MQLHKCPICDNTKEYSERYPNSVCNDCVSKALDKDGNVVKFYNTEMFGYGFMSIHYINNKKINREDHECYIDNIKCFAEEARFGGIVIQKT